MQACPLQSGLSSFPELLQVHSCIGPAKSAPKFSCRPTPFHTHDRCPSKATAQTGRCTNSHDRGQHHPKVTLSQEDGKKTTHTNSTVALPDIWSDCSSNLHQNFSGTTQREYSAIWCYHSSGKCWLGLTQLKTQVAPVWTTNTTGTKLCPQQATKAIADDWTKGKYGSATTVEHTEHT